MQTHGTRPTLGGMLLQHVIVFLICVVFPGAVTLMAPVTWMTFERSNEVVSCTTRTCMFFVVPFKTQQVNEVIGIGHRERAGKTERKREFGRTTDEIVHVDGEGFLQIHGADEKLIEVSVSPASLQTVSMKANDYLSSTEQTSVTIFAIANWKFGGLMGGVLTLFTLLYVVGYSLGSLKWLITNMMRCFAKQPRAERQTVQ